MGGIELCIEKINIITALIERFGKGGWKLFSFMKKRKKITDPYYFEEYNKKVFVKSDGNGVIVGSLKLYVNDPANLDKIVRTFDISDSKETTEFPCFNSLIETGEADPFNEFGLWYHSEGDIVTDIEEYYDEEDRDKVDDKKFLSFKLILNKAGLEKDKTYRITYALSIPGMYPINMGRFEGTDIEHKKYGTFKTSVSTYQTHEKLTYSVYTDNAMVFTQKPHAYCKGNSTKGKAKPNACQYRNNMFYEKFNFTLENPQEYDIIYMEWDLKNPKQQ